jgi:hypothetical protein
MNRRGVRFAISLASAKSLRIEFERLRHSGASAYAPLSAAVRKSLAPGGFWEWQQ